MHKYEFRFLNGVAEVYEVATGQVILHQPFKPMDANQGSMPQPWATRDEAYAWTQANFNHHLEDLLEDTDTGTGYNEPPTIDSVPGTSEE